MSQNIIEIVDITKKYGDFFAVDHLNLTIQKGEVFGLLGPNGAGKTTTILMLLGLTEPTSGEAKVCNINPTTNPIEVKRKVGYLPEDVGFYDDLSGFENLVYTARLNSIPKKTAEKKAKDLIERVGLGENGKKKTGKYSRGMRQRLGLADVLIKDPEVIILDEPTLGIDPKGVQELLELIIQLCKEEGLTVLISSHYLHHIEQICSRVGLFVHGKLIVEGDIHTLSQKLFSKDTFVVEAGISPASLKLSDSVNADRLLAALKSVKGVMTIDLKDNIFHIGCSSDITADIAKVIVESGVGLCHLNKKEYGLEDIYNCYFARIENHE